MLNITITPEMAAFLTAGAGKVFIEFADSMPDPGPNANYFVRWCYAFMQKLASNGPRSEAARTGGKVVVIPRSEETKAA